MPRTIHIEEKINMNDDQELFLRRKTFYLNNCLERLNWAIHDGYKPSDLLTTLDSIEDHITEIRSKLALKRQ